MSPFIKLYVETQRCRRAQGGDDLPGNADTLIYACARQVNAIRGNPSNRIRAELKPARVVVDDFDLAPCKLRGHSRLA